MPNDIPIKMYNIVQTIGNASWGGDKNGLFKLSYWINFEIIKPTIPPTKSGNTKYLSFEKIFFHNVLLLNYYIPQK